ncbi:MAG: Bifunctional protein GlmU [Chlamydiae bacterium]|nr:Bifunctional protein GlmU [Chlamydiota bacterium]
MIKQFLPSQFFDLGCFAHAALFSPEKPVWQALEELSEYLAKQQLGNIEAAVETGVYLSKPELISIGRGTVVEAGAYIKGPCIIGENCQIRHGAYIRGNVITGDDCVVGHATELKNVIFLNGVQAGHFSYVGDSILGNHVNLGAGTKCANLRLDQKNVPIFFEQKRIDSGLRKLGAIIGDGGQLGCNCVTNPGAIIGKGSQSHPCMTLTGVVSENHVFRDSF